MWLVDEGARAGGIGPNEIDRLDSRHLGDSILFATSLENTASVIDVGTGIGLPGIPLAIMMPATEFTLLDRSGRRTDLLKRVVKILDLTNCEVVKGEIDEVDGPFEALVARASLPPPKLLSVADRLLEASGIAVVGGSWSSKPVVDGYLTKEIPRRVLDQTVWLLIMRRP